MAAVLLWAIKQSCTSHTTIIQNVNLNKLIVRKLTHSVMGSWGITGAKNSWERDCFQEYLNKLAMKLRLKQLKT